MKSTFLPTPRVETGCALPFLRWPGGKRWAAPLISTLVRQRLAGRYIEPFLGGGAIFFRVMPERALLADLNPHLIETYSAVRDSAREVIRLLEGWGVSEDTFYRLRSWNPINRTERAARFLYLNRTGFAGMYRENREGHYNVPFGGGDRTHRALLETDILLRASVALKSAELSSGDFERALTEANAGDVVYCDPPYPRTQAGGFERYNGKIFSWEDQIRLSEAARQAQRRGVRVIVSNASHERIEQLYTTARVRILERPSCVSRTSAGRRVVSEALFIMDPTAE